MADRSYENFLEVRFDANRGAYKAALLVFLIGVSIFAFFLVFEIVALTDNPTVQIGVRHYRAGVFNELRAAIIGGGSGIIALGAVALVGADSYRNLRYWRQLRKPEAVIDAEGVRFEARGRAVSVPWSDIERLVLRRSISSSRSSSMLRIRISADSAPCRNMLLPNSPQGWYLIGQLEKQANVPYDNAIHILNRFSGSRLEIIERPSRKSK